MSLADNKAVVRSFYDAANRGDMDTCFALLSDDITWTNIGTTSLSGSYSGKPVLMEKLLGPLFGQLKAGIAMDVEALIAEGDHVVALANGTAETLDGRPYNNTYCQVMQIRDGQIVAVKEYLDTALTGSIFGFAG